MQQEMTMQETTLADRRHELAQLQRQIVEHPERPWTEERRRIAVLAAQLAGHQQASDPV